MAAIAAPFELLIQEPLVCREKNRKAQARHRERNKVKARQLEHVLVLRRRERGSCCLPRSAAPVLQLAPSPKALDCLQKAIEDLSAKNSTLTAEVANLKLELAIVSTLAQAKDSTLTRMRKVKVCARGSQ